MNAIIALIAEAVVKWLIEYAIDRIDQPCTCECHKPLPPTPAPDNDIIDRVMR